MQPEERWLILDGQKYMVVADQFRTPPQLDTNLKVSAL